MDPIESLKALEKEYSELLKKIRKSGKLLEGSSPR